MNKDYIAFFISIFLILFSFNSYSAKMDDISQDDFDDIEFTSENKFQIKDPLEKYNRKIFSFNESVDKCCIEYVARAYRKGMPKFARTSIRNFLNNLYSPISVFNSVLQGKTDNSLSNFSSFLINTTVGIGGIFDVAGKKGINYNQEDFGQTLGHYGFNYGFYIVLPILGPSSGRDFSGFLVDKSVNPIELNFLDIGGEENFINSNYRIGIAMMSGIDKRESFIDIIDDIRQDSFDPYATLRSAYIQRRDSEIKK